VAFVLQLLETKLNLIMQTLILGMGNRLFGDDGVGIEIAERLQDLLSESEYVKIETTNWGGFRIIDLLTGYKSAIIIDSINTGMKPVGFIHKWDYTDLINSVRMISFHDINFATAVSFAKKLEIPMPEKIIVYGIEINQTNNFSEGLSDVIKQSSVRCVDLILNNLCLHYSNKKFISSEKLVEGTK
jgi:hydrogenase maturation protease